MKLPKLTARQQIIAVGAALAVLAGLVIAFLVLPQILRLGSLGVQEQSALTELNAAKASYGQLQELKKTSRRTESDLLRVDRKAPEEAELPALIIQMQDISVKSGTGLLSIKPSAVIQKTSYAQIPIEIQLNGYFFSMLDFIYRIEKLPRVINITGIEIKEGKQGLPNIEAKLSALAFISTPGVVASTGTTGAAPATSATTGSTSATTGATGTSGTGGTGTSGGTP